MLPKVSVFLPTYNQRHFIDETIESILLQDYSNLEIVVGDDGSTDGTQERLLEYQVSYPSLFKLILSESNLGITANSNKILSECTGDYIALLGGDDIWLPGKIHKQVEWFIRNQDAAICHTKTESFDSLTGTTISITPESANPRNTPAGLGAFLEAPPSYVGSSFMIPRWAIPDSGFDERLRLVSDWLFTLDLLTKGRMGYIDEVLTRYRRHSCNVSTNYELMFADMMLACDIAEKKYYNYDLYINAFRTEWLMTYIELKCLPEHVWVRMVKQRKTKIFIDIIINRIKNIWK